ncbi:SMP-30/gluconolactonase/LRE family protein [Paenibacillus hunanensis]|uniref:stalk domain-containing protein n=1 Tax=Paenibacillus hunanensis TaxID=539262 RepID=UPI0020274CE8|nr:SMP-30/gluconolactonase/LRE family protein [Paenibacillus hunanensis]MCL9662692.1 SMP-30/gluconolactonase/LRE family protein [Paenibacillus hunanensis]
MMRNKALAACVLASGLVFLPSVSGATPMETDMNMTVDGKAVGIEGFTLNHRLYVPFETIAGQLGAETAWNEQTGILTLMLGEKSVTFNRTNDLSSTSPTALVVTSGEVLIPVRSAFQQLGYGVHYNPSTRIVQVKKNTDDSVSLSTPSTGMSTGESTTEGSTNTVTDNTYADLSSVTILTDLKPEQTTGTRIEGVVANERYVFTADMDTRELYRIDGTTGASTILTVLPRTGTGMALDTTGNLYIASGGDEGVIFKVNAADLTGEPFDGSKVETFASGVAGANGLAFAQDGTLYVTGGATGNLYAVTAGGQVQTYATGLTAERAEQQIVVNGIAIDTEGTIYTSNTSSGEVNRFVIQTDGKLSAAETIAKSPLLYGADGLTLGPDGQIYIAANERNAIVKVTMDGQVTDVARNDNAGPLEFPASVSFVGNTLYISNFDLPRGVNNPNVPGIGASIAVMKL